MRHAKEIIPERVSPLEPKPDYEFVCRITKRLRGRVSNFLAKNRELLNEFYWIKKDKNQLDKKSGAEMNPPMLNKH